MMAIDPLTDRVTRKIAAALAPRRIFLFGSRVRGDARPDSDLDLAVVYDGPLSKREARLAIHALFPRPDFSLDVFILSPDELEANQHVANSIAREVAEHGEPVYG